MSAHDLAQRIVAKAKKPKTKVAKKKEVKKIMKKAGMKLSKMKLRKKKSTKSFKKAPWSASMFALSKSEVSVTAIPS